MKQFITIKQLGKSGRKVGACFFSIVMASLVLAFNVNAATSTNAPDGVTVSGGISSSDINIIFGDTSEITFDVTPEGCQTETGRATCREQIDIAIDNESGVEWTDFHFKISGLVDGPSNVEFEFVAFEPDNVGLERTETMTEPDSLEIWYFFDMENDKGVLSLPGFPAFNRFSIEGGTVPLQAFGNNDPTITSYTITARPSFIPIPPAVWLFGSALVGLVSISRNRGDRVKK